MSIAFINNFSTILTDDLHSSGLTLPLPAAAAGQLDFSDGQHYLLTIAGIDQTEIVRVTDGLQIERGQEGTIPPAVWPAGSTVFCGITAGGLQALKGAGGGSEGPSIVVSDAPPDRPPAYPGEQWLTPYRCWVGVATGSLFDWKRTAGERYSAGWYLGPGANNVTVEPLVELLHLGVSGSSGSGTVTYILDLGMSPASLPEGTHRERWLVLSIHPVEGVSVILQIPFPIADHAGASLSPELLATASLDEVARTMTIELTERTSIDMRIDMGREEGESYFWLTAGIGSYTDPFADLSDLTAGGY